MESRVRLLDLGRGDFDAAALRLGLELVADRALDLAPVAVERRRRGRRAGGTRPVRPLQDGPRALSSAVGAVVLEAREEGLPFGVDRRDRPRSGHRGPRCRRRCRRTGTKCRRRRRSRLGGTCRRSWMSGRSRSRSSAARRSFDATERLSSSAPIPDMRRSALSLRELGRPEFASRRAPLTLI